MNTYRTRKRHGVKNQDSEISGVDFEERIRRRSEPLDFCFGTKIVQLSPGMTPPEKRRV